jgi:hypothetical protein
MLAGEFRQENLCDAWKDDVLQLKIQLYCAWLSLQRPLEDSRLPFASIPEPSEPLLPSPRLPLQHPSEDSRLLSIPEPSDVEMPTATSSSDQRHPQAKRNANCGGDQPVRKKAKVDPEHDNRPRFKCHMCPPASKKTFLSHGLRGHL